MQPTKLLAAALVLCGLCNFTNQAQGATGKLLAGTTKGSITPVTDEPLHEPVYARSLVLEIDHERLAFVSGNFFAPHRICVDKDGAIYVAEVIWPAKEWAPPKDLHPALQKFKLAE